MTKERYLCSQEVYAGMIHPVVDKHMGGNFGK